jgi:hypothetical protein
MEVDVSRWIFLKLFKYEISRKFEWEPSYSIRTDGQTDMTKLIATFPNFANAPNKTHCSATICSCRCKVPVLNLLRDLLILSVYPRCSESATLNQLTYESDLQFLQHPIHEVGKQLLKQGTYAVTLNFRQHPVYVLYMQSLQNPTDVIYLQTLQHICVCSIYADSTASYVCSIYADSQYLKYVTFKQTLRHLTYVIYLQISQHPMYVVYLQTIQHFQYAVHLLVVMHLLLKWTYIF